MQIEKEDLLELDSEGNPAQLYHLCIVNLVIGTLYCSKLNYKFGISRIMKSLGMSREKFRADCGQLSWSFACEYELTFIAEPFNRKLSPDTWFYTKRCLLALADNLSKHMMLFSDDLFYEMMQFLDAVEDAGANIKTVINLAPGADPEIQNRTVASEARYFKQFFLKLRQ